MVIISIDVGKNFDNIVYEYDIIRRVFYTLVDNINVLVKYDNMESKLFVLPKGFSTDFVTAGVFKGLFDSYGFRVASIIHDYCFFTGELSLLDSNKLFLDILSYYKTHKWKVWLCSLVLKSKKTKNIYNSYRR